MATGSGPNPGFGYNTWLNSAAQFVTAGIGDRKVVDAPIIASAPHDLYLTWGWRGRHIYVIPSLGMVVTVTPFNGQVPCPGTLCTFSNGYPGQGPGSGPGAHMDSNQPAQKEMTKGYHEFWRILMSAVKDQAVPDPGPWEGPVDDEFNPDLFFGNPEGQMDSSGFGQSSNEAEYFSDYAAVPGDLRQEHDHQVAGRASRHLPIVPYARVTSARACGTLHP